MFEIGKKIFFRDDDLKTRCGTIVSIVSETATTVTLKVKSDFNGIHYFVKKRKTLKKDSFKFEDQYNKVGHY